MGTDARMFAVKAKQSFYYDREYNLINSITNFFVEEAKFKEDGILKEGLIELCDTLSELYHNNVGYSEETLKRNTFTPIIEWLNTLDEDEIIFSRHSSQDEYFDLLEKGGYKEHDE